MPFNQAIPLDVILGATVLTCVAAFILGGLVKGTLGVGLPLLAVPLMSMAIPSPRAIGMVAVPVLLSNLWQMIDSRKIVQGWRRFWPLIAMQLISMYPTYPDFLISSIIFSKVVLNIGFGPDQNIKVPISPV